MITEEQFLAGATLLRCETAAIKAVRQVESSGSGFLEDGRLATLFEGHQFWIQLKTAGFDPAKFIGAFPNYTNIVYKFWTRKYYLGGEREWDRINSAIAVCRILDAPTALALNSASYGAFQIMGFNHRACGCSSAQDMIAFMNKGEAEQLQCFLNYVQAVKLDDELRHHDWANFARGYNGPGYKGNPFTTNDDYDLKLAIAYKRFSVATSNGQKK